MWALFMLIVQCSCKELWSGSYAGSGILEHFDISNAQLHICLTLTTDLSTHNFLSLSDNKGKGKK